MIPYLQVEDLMKRWGENVLFENIDFTIGKDQRVALIAKNGAGKSTLLNCISGKDTQDGGIITLTKDVKVGYLNQEPELNENLTVLEQAFESDSDIVRTIREYENAIETQDPAAMEVSIEKMNTLNAWDFEVRFKQILGELKITNFSQKVSQLSGGQRKRVALANVLINQPDLLILDEPTNHLDLDMIEWLEQYLEKSGVTLFMVTHDRYFLDRVCNEIIELDDNHIYRYKGNYSYYLEKREERIIQQNTEADKAKNLYKTELEWLRRMPKARGTKSKSRIDAAAKIKEKSHTHYKDSNLELNFKSSRLGKKIIEVENINKSFDDLKILDNFSYKFQRFEKIGIVGENGTGKSTFLNVITGKLAADSGIVEVGETIKFGYYRQDGMNFNESDRVIDIIKEIAEVIDLGDGRQWSASQFLQHFLFTGDMQYSHVEKLSGGERRRLYLCTILMQKPNFLILDEPTNDLDIMTLNVLEEYLKSFDGCVLIVSHDRYFMDKIVDHMFVFQGKGVIKDFPGNYSIYRDWKEEQDKEKKRIEKEEAQKKEVEKPKAVIASNQPRKMTYKEKLEFETLEKDIATLEEEKAALELDMNAGLISTDDLIEKSKRHAELSDILDEKELRWLELSEIV